MAGVWTTVVGDEACADVASRPSDVIASYPIPERLALVKELAGAR